MTLDAASADTVRTVRTCFIAVRSPKGVVFLKRQGLVLGPVQAVLQVDTGRPLQGVAVAQRPVRRHLAQVLGQRMHHCQVDWVYGDVNRLRWQPACAAPSSPADGVSRHTSTTCHTCQPSS